MKKKRTVNNIRKINNKKRQKVASRYNIVDIYSDLRIMLSSEHHHIHRIKNLRQIECPSVNIYNNNNNNNNNNIEILEKILYPMHLNEFLCNIYNRKALYICANDQTRVNSLISKYLYYLNIVDLLNNSTSDMITAWVRSNKSEGSHCIECTVDEAIDLYNNGASLYFRASNKMNNIYIRQFCKELDCPFINNELCGQIEIFITRKGHITEWRKDDMNNFTIQLYGQKSWKLKQEENMNHIDHHHHHHNVETTTLDPGDILYYPCGMSYQVQAITDSISINIAIYPKEANNNIQLVEQQQQQQEQMSTDIEMIEKENDSLLQIPLHNHNGLIRNYYIDKFSYIQKKIEDVNTDYNYHNDIDDEGIVAEYVISKRNYDTSSKPTLITLWEHSPQIWFDIMNYLECIVTPVTINFNDMVLQLCHGKISNTVLENAKKLLIQLVNAGFLKETY